MKKVVVNLKEKSKGDFIVVDREGRTVQIAAGVIAGCGIDSQTAETGDEFIASVEDPITLLAQQHSAVLPAFPVAFRCRLLTCQTRMNLASTAI